MRIGSVEMVCPAGVPDQLPIRSLQTSSLSASILKLAIMVPAALALLAPYLLVAGQLATDEGFRDVILARPGSALQCVIGLAFWTLLFGWPLKRLSDQIARVRTVKIDGGKVDVCDGSLLRQASSRIPLTDFIGIAHHVRASLSGVRHELVLVHPHKDRSVLIAMAPRMTERDVEQLSNLLSMPVVPPQALYGLNRPRPARSLTPREPAVAL